MTLDEYQAAAKETDSVPLEGSKSCTFFCMVLLTRSGKVASLLKKCMRQSIEINKQKPEFVSRLGRCALVCRCNSQPS